MARAYEPAAVEACWQAWWSAQGLHAPSTPPPKASNAADETVAPTFSLLLPPPNVTGVLHLGHALTVAVQDALTRWHRMRGARTLWMPGCDHAGIATQVVVERELQRSTGCSRHDLGRKAFVQRVWEWRDAKAGRIECQTQQLGASLDWGHAYFTLDAARSQAVTEAFVRLHDRGLVYRALRPINWSSVLQSAISNVEVEKMPLAGPTELCLPGYPAPIHFGLLYHVRYPVYDANGRRTGCDLVVATTRPETMPADMAVAVHPQDKRYRYAHGGTVQHPLTGHRLPIVLDADLVDLHFGTGAVKITPGRA